MRIAIIGGGPGGLITAYLLQQRSDRPLDITIFEATHRLGGKILTNTFDTAPVDYEAGAAELYDYSVTGPDPLRELVRDLGLSTRPMHGRTVILDGQPLQTRGDIRRHLGQNALDALEDFRRRATQFISPAAYYESDWKQDNEDFLSRQRFDELLRTVPDEAARRYIRVAVHSDLATEPHRTSALYGLQNFLMNEPGYMDLYTIDGGIETLVRELSARLRSRVLLNHRVTHVEATPDGAYRVKSRGTSAYPHERFDIVVAALPVNWLPSIEWSGGALTEAMRAHHAHYDYPAHYLRVSLLFEEPFWRDRIAESYFMLDAFGGCCVYDETSRGSSAPFGVLGWLLAGEAALNWSNLSDSGLIEEMLDSLPPWLQRGRGLLCEGRVHRWAGTVNGWPAGYPAREPDSRHVPDPDGNPGLLAVGDYLFDSTLNGVMDSAEVVAERILEMHSELHEAFAAHPSNQA
ncbi:MAG TPA: FAD-dependent oxidoreductase [Bryobacteraceae bacterium]|jgi:monoamine oxidase